MSYSRQQALQAVLMGMGLPYLELTADKNKAEAPRRLGAVFFGNGVNPHEWWAKGSGSSMELSKSLQPLSPVKNKMIYFKGLWNPTSVEGKGGHYPKMNVLSGAKVKQTTTDIEVGTSMDQAVARSLKGKTLLPSLVLGTEGPGISGDQGFSSMYSSYISWSSKNRPSSKELNPRQAFDRLFSNAKEFKKKRSILDAVLKDSKRLQSHLSVTDKMKLDEFEVSIRELEQRMENADKVANDSSLWQPNPPKNMMDRPGVMVPGFVDDYLRMMFDIMTLAYQMNKTQVATFMMNNDLSGMNFSHIEGIKGGSHQVSHHTNRPDLLAIYQKINQHVVMLYSEFLQKLDKIQEGERTLLDNSMILLCSSLWDGNAHDSKQLPVLLAGQGGGSIRSGQSLDFSGKQEERKMCRLHLALMQKMGMKIDSFGDATEAMKEIS